MMEVCFLQKIWSEKLVKKEVMESTKLSRFYIKIFKILI